MHPFDLDSPFGKACSALLAVIVMFLAVHGLFFARTADEYKPKANQPCKGAPLYVDYAYYGGMLEPHACAPQCKDEEQHYIVYTNGKATQCQILPGCLDWGEDHGVTCQVDEAVILNRPR